MLPGGRYRERDKSLERGDSPRFNENGRRLSREICGIRARARLDLVAAETSHFRRSLESPLPRQHRKIQRAHSWAPPIQRIPETILLALEHRAPRGREGTTGAVRDL